MKKGKKKSLSGALALIVFTTLVLIMLPAQGRADCTAPTGTDADNDGFTEAQECAGFTSLLDGTHVYGFNENSGLQRYQYLDPSSRDLFVILVPSIPSLIPPNPTATISALGITTHEVYVSSPLNSRQVTSGSAQLAIQITENSDTTMKDSKGNYLPFGNSNYGTPNGLDGATIWTQRIKTYIYTVACPPSLPDLNCKDTVSGAVGKDAVIAAYIKNTFPHEAGHVMKLTTTSNSKYGGYHYAAGSDTVMEQSIIYKNGVFTIPQGYASGDATAAKLR